MQQQVNLICVPLYCESCKVTFMATCIGDHVAGKCHSCQAKEWLAQVQQGGQG